jgi:hypothetical protein
MNSQTYERQIRHRLTVLRHAEEISFNVASTCRHYGISRPTFYKWERRFKAEGPEGLRERSRAPKNSPNATSSSGGGKNHLSATELPLWTPENCHVFGALSRSHHQRLEESGGYSRSLSSIAFLPPSAINAMIAGGSAMRSNSPVIRFRSM